MNGKTLIVYYSQAVGNTKKIADRIHDTIGADILRIDTVVHYEGTSEEISTKGQEEIESGYKPELKNFDIDLSKYDRFIIGTPTWWYTIAPAMRTFLASYDWAGETIIPFMTNGGCPGHIIDDIKELCKGAVVENAKEIKFDSIELDEQITSDSEIDEWISSIK